MAHSMNEVTVLVGNVEFDDLLMHLGDQLEVVCSIF